MKLFKRSVAAVLAVLLCLLTVPAIVVAADEPVDTAFLKSLLTEADSLQESNYTAESWQQVTGVVEIANKALKSKEQEWINAAASLLEEALDSLVHIDRSNLEKALNKIDRWVDTTNAEELWSRLQTLNEAGELALTAGDQKEIDRITEEINDTLSQLRSKRGVAWLWIILFVLSLLGNVYFVLQRRGGRYIAKHYHRDDVPLVDYDIADDT